jgi:hypothetical protein
MINGFSNPAMTNEEYISVLERQSLPETAAALRELFDAVPIQISRNTASMLLPSGSSTKAA